MELVTPGLGLVFWMLLSFTIVMVILKTFAWKPILKSLKDREDFIDGALKSADKAKAEMESLQASNEKILQEARNERDKLIAEAREVKEKIIGDAKGLATIEGNKIIETARINIQNEKNAAMIEIKNLVATLSIDIAEKILEKELKNDQDQKDLINNLLKEINLN